MTIIPRNNILKIEPYKGGLSKAHGKKVIKLSSNETPFGPSDAAIKAYIKAAGELFRYPEGSSELLRKAIGEVHGLDPERIVCGAGSDEIISFLCAAYAGAGDEVLYTEHGFLMYKISAMVSGATPIAVREKNLTADVDALLAALTKKTKIVFLANPNNPTGTYIPKSEILRLRKGLPEGVLLVIDGAYAEYVEKPDYTSGEEIVDMGENTVTTRTFSKIYGLASLRVGWAYCPESIASVLNRVRGPFNVSGPGIAAASAAVMDVDLVKKAKTHNTRCLELLYKEVQKIGLESLPSVGNFFLIKFPENNPNKSAAKAHDFLMQRGIILRPVANYNLPNYLRMTVGLEEDNRAVVMALKEFMS